MKMMRAGQDSKGVLISIVTKTYGARVVRSGIGPEQLFELAEGKFSDHFFRGPCLGLAPELSLNAQVSNDARKATAKHLQHVRTKP